MERSLVAQEQRIGVFEGWGFIVSSRVPQKLPMQGADRRGVRRYMDTGAYYCSDFGSERFLGDFWFRRAISSEAQAGLFTLPSRMMSLALTFFPYSFSLALPSERRVEPSRETPANNPLLRE